MSFKFKFILMALIFMANAAYANDYELSLKSQAFASSDSLVFADIIDKASTSTDLVEKYGQLDIQSYVNDGVIKPSQILILLAKSGLDLEQVRLLSSASQSITVSQESNLMPSVKETILAYANARSTDDKFYDVLIEDDRVRNIRFNSQDQVSVEGMEGDWAYPSFRVLLIDQTTKQPTRFTVKAHLIKGVPSVIAKRSFLPGDVLTREDVEIVNRQSSQNPDELNDLSFLLSNEKLVVKSMIEKGQPILKSSISNQVSIQKGSVVSLVTGDNHFQVRVMGRVKEVIDNGQSVLVENMDSKKEILGKPISANEVKVFY